MSVPPPPASSDLSAASANAGKTTAELDHRFLWHPFTQMQDWCAAEPLVIVGGRGAWLQDDRRRWYLDGNSSIWTNLHGHRNARLDAALTRQLERFAHSSFLGLTHQPAAELAAALCAFWPPETLQRVFFSDNGSTAIEVALKMAVQFWQLSGQPQRRSFAAFGGAYHGDTVGAASLGGVSAFTDRFAHWHFPVERVHCPGDLERLHSESLAAVVIEPLVQGANQIHVWPSGTLAEVRAWCDRSGVFLIADEVLTGFGRTGTMFACQREGVVPDFLALAKGLTGGYLPLAATLTTERVFKAFLGGPDRTFYYGHSYCGHALGCAVALENLAIFKEEQVLERLQAKIRQMTRLLDTRVRCSPFVYEVRQCGFVAGIELRQPGGMPFERGLRMGAQVCVAARGFGLLTRPVLDTVVLMPPLCITDLELEGAVDALAAAIEAGCNPR